MPHREFSQRLYTGVWVLKPKKGAETLPIRREFAAGSMPFVDELDIKTLKLGAYGNTIPLLRIIQISSVIKLTGYLQTQIFDEQPNCFIHDLKKEKFHSCGSSPFSTLKMWSRNG